ncbi:ABC transporter ATP-binding protein [Streptomyces sp. WAC 06738]|uniref:ABC transporter ATP-binding protein n=1 Tax=Streptomyces sp. WAC 06738 TaxID=2203210 RepID=UPI0019D11F8B|nr:ABC transporter ATP-binding protein [Streptomyces sp. WAC 06738]
MSGIHVAQASKLFVSRRRETLALSRTELSVASGEIVCLVGPSGCGKTTLMNLIAGFEQPTEGSVEVGGRRVEGPSADRAVVFQSDAVFPWLTVRDNVSYGPRMRGVPRSEWAPAVDHFLAQVGLSDFADAYPKELSGGMRKRVDLARAYVNEPDVLLLDEPFGALDLFTKEEMWLFLIKTWEAAPKTVLFVTHDIEEALFLGDRIAVMTPRPARVREIVQVPFDRPRDLDVRGEPEFQQLRLRIAHLLRETTDDAA